MPLDITVKSKPGEGSPSIEVVPEEVYIANAKLVLEELAKEKIDKFPLEVFPPRLQMCIADWHSVNGFPVDWYGLGVLVAGSMANGNAYGARYKTNWTQRTGLYAGIVGNSGAGKSKLINICLGPLFEEHKRVITEFKEQEKEWSKKKKEIQRENEQNKNDKNYIKKIIPPKPENTNQLIYEQYSIENLVKGFYRRPRGITVIRQELAGFFKSFGQYKSGNNDDEQQFLTIWDGDNITRSTEKSGTTLIQGPNLNIFGGIQNGILEILAKGDRKSNGTLARFLVAFPDDLDKPYHTEKEIDPMTLEQYGRMIETILRMPVDISNNLDPECDDLEDMDFLMQKVDTVYWPLTPKAKALMLTFLNNNVDDQNNTNNQTLKEMYSKMDSYVLRFAVILKLFDIVNKKNVEIDSKFHNEWKAQLQQMQIEEHVLKRAIKLVHYFKQTANKLLGRVENPAKMKMSEKIYAWYKALPRTDAFRNSTAVGIAKELKISAATVNNWLAKREYFDKFKKGTHTYYERKYD